MVKQSCLDGYHRFQQASQIYVVPFDQPLSTYFPCRPQQHIRMTINIPKPLCPKQKVTNHLVACDISMPTKEDNLATYITERVYVGNKGVGQGAVCGIDGTYA